MTTLSVQARGSLHAISQGASSIYRFEQEKADSPLLLMFSLVPTDETRENHDMLASKYKTAKVRLTLEFDENSQEYTERNINIV